jgi:hypothetical protein
MSRDVHLCSLFSRTYNGIGISSVRNPSPIFLILFPEYPLLGTRGKL